MKLAVCIPNYNRPEKLDRLIRGLADQIMEENLGGQVEICISDDKSRNALTKWSETPDACIRMCGSFTIPMSRTGGWTIIFCRVF